MQLHEGNLFDDRYRLIKWLGSGGFSEVWLVEDTRVGGKQMALKVYAPGTGLDEDGVKLISDEFKMVFDFHHGNLLKPTYFDVCDRSPYLILPYCAHGSSFPRNNNCGDTTPGVKPEPTQQKSNNGKYILAAVVVIVLGIMLFNYTRQADARQPVTPPSTPIEITPVVEKSEEETAQTPSIKPITPKPEETAKKPPVQKLYGLGELRRNAEQGDAVAQFNLGLMYANGLGVPQNDNEAVNWYRKAADQGNEDAKKSLDRLVNK